MAKTEVATRAKRKTAPPNEKPNQERARINRLEASARKSAGAKGESKLTEDFFSRRSVNEHSEHPEAPGDSTVKHSLPVTGADISGQKGFPQGEYDVTPPAKQGAAANQNVHDSLIESHVGAADVDEIMKASKESSRLSDKEYGLISETLPVGAVIERAGQYDYRVHFGNRWGHGTTFREAVESFVLGTNSGPDAATQAFKALPVSQRKEIEERDRSAAQRLGQAYDASPDAIARKEAVETAEADAKAKPAAANAVTDGAEKASARNEAGQAKKSDAKNRK